MTCAAFGLESLRAQRLRPAAPLTAQNQPHIFESYRGRLLRICMVCSLGALGALAGASKYLRQITYSDSFWRSLRRGAPWAATLVSDGAASASSVRLAVRQEIEIERRWRSGSWTSATLPMQRCRAHERMGEATAVGLHTSDGEDDRIVVTGCQPPMLHVWTARSPHVHTHCVRGRAFDRFQCGLLPAAMGQKRLRALSEDRRAAKTGCLYLWDLQPTAGRADDGTALRRPPPARPEVAGITAAVADDRPARRARRMFGHRRRLSGAALDVTRATLATVDEEGTLICWDLSRVEPSVLGRMVVGAALESLGMADASRLLVCGARDGTIRLVARTPAGGDLDTSKAHDDIAGPPPPPASPRSASPPPQRSALQPASSSARREGSPRSSRHGVQAATKAEAEAGEEAAHASTTPGTGDADAPPGASDDGADLPPPPPLDVADVCTLHGHTGWVTHLEVCALEEEGAVYNARRHRADGQPVVARATLPPMTSERALLLVSGSRDHTVVLWRLRCAATRASGEMLSVLSGHTRWITGLAVGKQQPLAGLDWSAPTPTDEGRGRRPSLPCRRVVPDRAEPAATADSDAPCAAEGEADGRGDGRAGADGANGVLPSLFVVSASADGTLKVWGAHGGALLATLRGHTRPLTDMALRSTRLVSCALDKTVRAWELEPLLSRHLQRRGTQSGTPACPSTDRVVVGSVEEERLPSDVPELLCAREHEDFVRVLAFSAERIVSCGDEGKVRVLSFTGEPPPPPPPLPQQQQQQQQQRRTCVVATTP